MALNQEQKELLAVCRYFNQQVEKKNVARLVAKLCKDFDMADVRALTGFSENEIWVLLNSLPKKKERQLEPVPFEESESTGNGETSGRLTIHLNADSDLVQRVAYDISKAIEGDLQPGDMYWSAKEIMEKFSCGAVTVTKANRTLVSHNWIQPIDESNKRKGYIVK